MLSKSEAAQYSGFSDVKRFEAHVRVRPVNFGDTVRYDRQRLDEWIDTLSECQPSKEFSLVEAAGDEGARDRH